jgi:hypothetical protein
VQGSLNVGKKELTTGWEQYIAGEGIEPYAESTQEFDPTLAFMAGIEPRLRFYTVPTGPVKPYVLTAANLRFYDGYVVPDLDTIKYPDRSGGLSAGMTLGGGLAFDAPGGFLAFLEVPWTYLFSPQPFKRDTPAIFDPPAARSQSNQVLAIRAGLGFRI